MSDGIPFILSTRVSGLGTDLPLGEVTGGNLTWGRVLDASLYLRDYRCELHHPISFLLQMNDWR